MSARKKQAIVIAALVVGVALTLLIGRWSREMELGISIVVVLVIGLLEVILFRCPHCGRRLGRGFRPGKYCPYCGKIIN